MEILEPDPQLLARVDVVLERARSKVADRCALPAMGDELVEPVRDLPEAIGVVVDDLGCGPFREFDVGADSLPTAAGVVVIEGSVLGIDARRQIKRVGLSSAA